MTLSRQTLGLFAILAAPLTTDAALAQIDLPPTAVTAGREEKVVYLDNPIALTISD